MGYSIAVILCVLLFPIFTFAQEAELDVFTNTEEAAEVSDSREQAIENFETYKEEGEIPDASEETVETETPDQPETENPDTEETSSAALESILEETYETEVDDTENTTVPMTDVQQELDAVLEKITSRSGVAMFFIGPDFDAIERAEELIAILDSEIADAVPSSNTALLEDLESKRNNAQRIVSAARETFSLFGWLIQLFQ